MRRTGPTRIAALALITLLIGLPGLLRAGCHSCGATSHQSSACHQERGPAFHPACCGGNPTFVSDCCGPAGAPSSVTAAAVAPKAPSSAAICPATAPALFAQFEGPQPVRHSAETPCCVGVELYTLHSNFLI